MIGNPTRPGDLAVTVGHEVSEVNGLWVRVISKHGDKRTVRYLQGTEFWLGYKKYVLSAGEVDWAWDDYLKPIRPPAPEQSVEREEHLAGVV